MIVTMTPEKMATHFDSREDGCGEIDFLQKLPNLDAFNVAM